MQALRLQTDPGTRLIRVAITALALALAGSAAADTITRSRAQVAAFKRDNPCPATGRRHGPCPGWQVDHTRPLCIGGMDSPENMVWLTVADHKFKTFIDQRECRKAKRAANTPAR